MTDTKTNTRLPATTKSTAWEETEDRLLLEEDVSEVKSKVRSLDDYILEETETRNVIMVGRTRSGKTTTIGVLKDTCYKPPSFSIFSETAQPKFASFALMAKQGNPKKYTINMIDTPGLFEQKEIGTEARDNEMIVNTISECAENEVTSVNSLMIFVSFEAGIRSDDIEALQHFLYLFGGDGVNLALCITRSENRNEENKKELIAQLQKHPTLGPIIKEKNIQILFMGCVDYLSSYTEKKNLMKAYKPVYDMREQVLQWIFKSESKRLLSELPVLKGTIEKCEASLIELIEELKYFYEVKDFDLARTQERLQRYKKSWQNFLRIKSCGTSPQMPALYEDLTSIARKIEARQDIKQEIKNELVGLLKLPKLQLP